MKKKKPRRNFFQMIRTRGVLYTLLYYHIILYAVILILIYLTSGYLAQLFAELIGVTEHGRVNEFFYNVTMLVIPLGMYVIWGVSLFASARAKSYSYLTYGRSYASDHSEYSKSYSELVCFYNKNEPHKMYTDDYPVQNWRQCKGINFGYNPDGRAIFLPENCEYNFAIFGPPGSSKTAGFCNVNAITFPGSCLIVDIKEDIYQYVVENSNRNIARFCPDDPDAINVSWHYDPLENLTNLSVTDRKLKIESIAVALIPDDGGNEGNYFPKTARRYFRGITHLLLHEDPYTSFPEIIHEILEGNYAEWVYRAEESDCTEARELLLSLKGNNEKNVSGAYDNLTDRLNVYSNPVLDELLTWKKGKTLTVNTLDHGYDVYLQIVEKHLTSYGPLLTMIINSFSNDFLDRPDTATGAKNRHVLMMLDELSSLHLSYDLLNVNLSKLRSKSVLTAIVLQNLPQLRRLYGADGAEALLGNCHVQAILGANDPSTAEYFSRKLGVKKEYRVSTSISTGKTETAGKTVSVDDKVPVYRPEDVADLKAENQNILYVDGKYTFLRKLNSYKEL